MLPVSRALSLSGAILDQDDIPPLEVLSLEGEEAVNSLFEYRVVVQTPEREPGLPPWHIDEQRLIGQPLTVHLELEGAGTFEAGARGASGRAGIGAGVREISGVVAETRFLDADARHLQLEIVLRPGVWQASLGWRNHAFHDMSVIDVLGAVLGHYPWPVDKRLIETYPPMDRITQWGENDWDFCCRLMEQSGINFHFEHEGQTHRLILSDHNAAFQPFGKADADAPGPYHRIPIHPPGHRIDREYIHAFATTRRQIPTRWETRDHDYTRPGQELVASAGAVANGASHQPLEAYHWRVAGAPGGALWSQPDAGRDPQAHTRSRDLARWLARIRHEGQQQHAERAEGQGHIRGLVPGRTFHLEGHRQAAANAEHLILWAHLSVRAPGQESQPGPASAGWAVHTRFTTQPTRAPLRPALTRAKPRVAGPEVGFVVGPHDGQVHTDHLGRIKVWEPWQRGQPRDGTASPWLRVVQPWAGNQQGALFLPRVGQEVTIEYYGGDPDLPVVTGSLHDGANLPGWQLPGQHALAGFRTRELGEGGGNSAAGRSNHLAMDDTRGEIQVQLKSDHQHSSLSLGYITRIEDQLGRKDARGEGAELRTDGHGALRAALGLLLTTYPRQAAAGGMKEMQEVLRLLDEALQQLESHAQAAVQLRVQEPDDQLEVLRQLRLQLQQLAGTQGEALSELAAPHLALAGSAGVAISARHDAQISAGAHAALISRMHTTISAGINFLVSAGKSIRMLAQRGMRLVTSNGDLELQAQNARLLMTAQQQVEIASLDDWLELKARKGIRLTVGSTCLEVTPQGFDLLTLGHFTVNAEQHALNGPKGRAAHLNEMPDARFDDKYQLVDRAGAPIANSRWRATRSDGSVLEGATDANGYIDIQKSDASENLKFEFPDRK
ncbi:MAG: type VI secretion system tip protein VgrG [Burkholderiales bacterium]|nr:type VI secretion system tip protein VgrG [Burkholderiales bacterium]